MNLMSANKSAMTKCDDIENSDAMTNRNMCDKLNLNCVFQKLNIILNEKFFI